MTRVLAGVLWMLFPFVAAGQVVEQGSSFLSSANAIMPGCTDSDGGGGATEATASCAASGYAGASSAQTSLSSSTSGGEISAFSQASATSIGPPASQNASAAGGSTATITWQTLSNTHYSLSIATSGGATASFDGGGGALPPSGIATPGFYTLQANAGTFAQAFDSGGVQTVTVGPRDASARVAFASVGSATLILGTITAGGTGLPDLLVEALQGGSVVASALTGDDGTYLLPDLPGEVVLRVSDPSGALGTEVSAPQTPPATFDTDLSPAIPALPGGLRLLIVLALLAAAVPLAARVGRTPRPRHGNLST